MSRDINVERAVQFQREIDTLKDEKRSLIQVLATKDAEIERLKSCLSPAYVEPRQDGRDLVMTEQVKEHVFNLREEVEMLRNALVDIQYYCTHVERSSVDGAQEIARNALANAAPAQKSESEVIEIDAAGRVNRQIAEELASRNADVERLEAIIEKWKTSIPVEDKSGDPVDDPERVGAFVAKQFDKLEMLEKRGWTCANCGAEHAYDHAGIIMQRENGIVHYCCGCEGAVKTLEEARAYAATLRLALVESMITPEALLIAGKPDCIAQEVWDQIVRSVEIARAALGIA